MNTTLDQAVKILGILKSVPYPVTQRGIETGFLNDALTTATMETFTKRVESDLFSTACITLLRLARPEDIVVTKPVDPDTYHSDIRRKGKFQVRVWRKEYGHFKGKGHVSDGGFSQGGPLLCETYVDHPQTEEIQEPMTGNGELEFNLESISPDLLHCEWIKTLKIVPGKGSFWVFTIRRKS